MFEKISFGWELVRQSFRVLRDEPRLMVFPLLSSIACLLVLAGFAVPLWGTPQAQAVLQERQAPDDPLTYAVLFLFYFVNYFVIVFFNSALLACAVMRFRGRQPTLGDGLRIAMNRVPQIAGWALVSATVGLVLKIIESRSERFGQLVAGLMGMAWSIVTYLVVPVLVMERAGPIEALRRSTALLKKTWGEALTAHMSAGWIFFVIFLVALLPLIVFIGLGVAAFGAGQVVLGGLAVAAVVILVILISLVSSTLSTILLAAVYLYAAEGKVPGPFEPELLQGAFESK
jgi:type IV secretory pathway VirB6-like protein